MPPDLITGFWTVSSSSQVKGLNFDIAPMWRGKERAVIPFGSGLAIVDGGGDIPTNRALLSSKAFLSAAALPRKVNMNALPHELSITGSSRTK